MDNPGKTKITKTNTKRQKYICSSVSTREIDLVILNIPTEMALLVNSNYYLRKKIHTYTHQSCRHHFKKYKTKRFANLLYDI
jgi:hypothetical protein